MLAAGGAYKVNADFVAADELCIVKANLLAADGAYSVKADLLAAGVECSVKFRPIPIALKKIYWKRS